MFAENLTQTLRILTIAILSLLLASCGSGSGQDSVDAADGDSAAARYQLAFADYFGDPPDADSRSAAKAIPKAALPAGNWVVDTGYGENGWGNDEWQRYDNSTDNLFTQNGNLVIRARCATAPACGKRDGTITSAKVTSKNRINVRYGIIKARIKMPAGIGMWPAFWTLGSDIDERPWPNAGELDIVEMHYYYSDRNTTHFSTHWAGPRYTAANRPVCSSGVGAIDPAEEENCKTESKTFDKPLTDGFHVYEIEWSENNIVGKIDGITYFNQAIDPATMEEFLKDHYLILNVAVGGTLGGPFGPSMSAADWAKPGNTDMLVDWVEVFERVPPSKGTLIDEAGGNLSYNRIINSAEIGGAFVEADLENRAVTPLVGNSSLRLKYSTSIAESGNGTPASFSGAIFDFNSIDLSDYSKLVFSLNTSQFKKFESIGVEFQDSRYAPPTVTEGAVSVRTNSTRATLIEINGDWKTYEIPLRHYAGVNMGDVVALGFFNPVDASGALIGGKLYVDDIRFVRSKKCTAVPTVAFDSLNYNPLTNVAAVTVKDACAAGSLALVTVDNGTDDIMVGVQLDAAGRGQGLFNLVGGTSVCETSDSASIIRLSGSLMAEYKRANSAKGGSAKAVALAGIDDAAPGSTIAGAKTFIYASDPGQSLGFIPDTDFFFSDFGSGSSFDGNVTTDASFSPVFSVSDLAGQQAILAMFGFTDGFTADADSINFKVKNLPGDFITVKLGQDGGPETGVAVNLDSYAGSTALADGWYEVSIPMSDFPNANVYDYVVFASNNSSGANFTYLITDIFLQESAGSVPAECAGVVVPPVTGSGTGATGATGGPFSVSFDDIATTYDFIGFGNPDTINTLGTDPLDSGNLVAMTTKLVGAQVWAGVTVATTPGITYPVTVANSRITIRIYSPGAGLVVRMKLEESGTASNSVETEATTTVDDGWETLTFDFNNNVAGTPALNPAFNYDKLSLFFGFGTLGNGTTYTWDTIEFGGGGGGGPTQVDLPVSFDEANVDYTTVDFGGNATTLVTDPTDGGNTVAQSVKAGDAQLWAGTTIGADPNGFATAIPFTATNTSMTVRVYSPDAGIPVRLKVENAGDNTITVETEALTTGVNTWETLTFDFSNEVGGTAALNLANTYDKASIFFNFGTDGATAGEKTYLWDDVEFVTGGGGGGPTQVDLPVSFDEANVDYTTVDFGGNATTLVTDPTDGGNTVAQSVKAGDAQLWAGTTIGADPNGFATAIPFTATNTSMTVRVYSPDAGIPVRLKVENAGDNTITVETEALTTGVNTWETLTFDFSNEVGGTAALNLANTYDKASIFFNFGTDGATAGEKTYLWDDVEFVTGGGGGGPTQVDLPVSFDEANVDYSVTDFGGNATTLVTDPTDGGNTVAQSVKAGDAQLWAGTTIGADPNGFATAIPFTATNTSMTVRVYSPDAGIPVRLKVENAGDNTITVETEAMTTGVNTWETLTFDFANEAAGTAALNLANTYDKASIFFNFGTDGATAGEKTYLWDDVEFVTGGGGGGPTQVDLPVSFDEANVDYSVTDFGGNATTLVTDPTDGGNTVAQSVKAGDAQLWAGTTIGADPNGFATAIPFTATNTSMTVRVYSPDAGIPVRLKVENAGDNTITVETEALTTGVNTWETLTFDFANEAAGTAALNLANTYDKASIFFNFGTDGATAGEKTYLWDDVEFVTGGGGGGGNVGGGPTGDFEDSSITYVLTDFGGNTTTLVADPTDAGNTVAQSIKAGDAQLWAGTTLGDDMSDNGSIPFTMSDTQISVRVYSPQANIPVRLKVENLLDPTISVETETMTTVADAWETLTFDFANEVSGTTALDLLNTYNKLSIFFNFGTDGATAGEQTYLWDDVEFIGGGGIGGGGPSQVDLPVTFDAPDVDYSLIDFGDAFSELVADPADGTNTVVRTMKPVTAPLWAGTTIGADPNGFATAIPFTADNTRMTVRVYSPDAGIPVRLKVEKTGDPTITVETEAMTTGVDTWETLTFDFANEAAGTAALNLANTYDKASIFFNFGTDGATAGDKTYYWDDVEFVTGGGGPTQVELPVSFDEANVDYTTVDFGSNATTLVTDPTDGGNTVAQSVKAGDAQLWAGTTIGADPNGFASAIPFTATNTSMTVRVYSPDAGIPVRLKVENAGDNTITVETEALTTGVNTWETLTFDFSNEAAGTAALNLANTYDKASIFFNFGTDGATAGEKTYLWDDVMFVTGGGGGGGATFVNGDFETGDFTGWVQTPDAGTSATPGIITMTAPPAGQAGTAVVRLQAAGEAAGSQDVLLSQVALGAGSIAQGQTINVSFDLYGSLSGAGGVVFVELIYLNSDGDDVGRNFVGAAAPYAPNSTWTTHAGSKAAGFTAVGTMVSVDGGVTLELKASCGPVPGCGVDAYIDNVTYTVTPL